MNKIKEFFSKKLIKKLIITTISIVFVVCLLFYEMVRERNYLEKAVPYLDWFISFHRDYDGVYITGGSWFITSSTIEKESVNFLPTLQNLSYIECSFENMVCKKVMFYYFYKGWLIKDREYEITDITNNFLVARTRYSELIIDMKNEEVFLNITSPDCKIKAKLVSWDDIHKEAYKKAITLTDTPVLYLAKLIGMSVEVK